MSNHIISLSYKRDLGTLLRKSLMVLLADKASDDGAGIYASKQTMADELCCSRKAVIETINAFVAEGLLVELGHRPNANGYTVEYCINVDALAALPLVGCHANRRPKGVHPSPTVTRHPELPVTHSDATRHPELPHPSPRVTQTPLEPSMNPSEAKASSAARAKPTAKATLLPEDWQPEPLSGDLAAEVRRMPEGFIQRECDRFRDYWAGKAGAAARKRDWQATWRNWIRKAIDDGSTRAGHHHNSGTGAAQAGEFNPMVRAIIARRNRRLDGA